MACMLAESLNDPFIESSDSFVASAPVSIATGWSEPVPGRELHPLKSSAFHGALLRQLTTRTLTSTAPTNSCARLTVQAHPLPVRPAMWVGSCLEWDWSEKHRG